MISVLAGVKVDFGRTTGSSLGRGVLVVCMNERMSDVAGNKRQLVDCKQAIVDGALTATRQAGVRKMQIQQPQCRVDQNREATGTP